MNNILSNSKGSGITPGTLHIASKGIEVAKKKGLLHDQVRPEWVNCEIDLSEENATTMHDALAT
ncbi:hypothetical protein [Dermacoccus nishinomiyaensis]|uniref:hypothetical protein n=1 Tax=Dermacoccus nishinomiyaensis TaxID=1274 RepID=UPI001483BA3F|nr:hypothetical protein [Dermacoccus nishinomiyaensis]